MHDFFDRYDHLIMPVTESGCWLWLGNSLPPKWLATVGYGWVRFENKTMLYAHRMAYECVHGDGSAKGLMVRHRCDVPLCVNPDHLLIGTAADNSRDMMERMRYSKGSKRPNSKLTESDVKEILGLLSGGLRQKEIGAIFGVDQSIISDIKNFVTWRHVPRRQSVSEGLAP